MARPAVFKFDGCGGWYYQTEHGPVFVGDSSECLTMTELLRRSAVADKAIEFAEVNIADKAEAR